MSTFLSRSLLISHHHPPTPHPHPLTPHPQQQETKSFHFIFVLDESRSIGTHWSYLETAYRGFLTRRVQNSNTLHPYTDLEACRLRVFL
jgi:hypothetical protein